MNDSHGFTAATDLRSFQYRAINIGGTLSTKVMDAHGILQTHTDSGEDGQLVYKADYMKFRSGGAVAAGGRMKINSGGVFVAAASGDTSVGFAWAAVTSGSIGHGAFDFVTPTYHVSSNG